MDTARVILLEQNSAPFLQALANYVEPLRSALDTSADEEKLAENQLLCQRIMEFIAGKVGGHEIFLQPAADSQPVDLLIYVHCLIASCFKNIKSLFLELAQEVAEFILAVPEVKRADWIEEILFELTQAHVATKEYSKAAQVCLVHSKLMKLNLNSKLSLLSSAARYWSQGGELEKSIEVTNAALAASTHLGVSEWKSQATLQMSIAILFDKKGQTADAVAARKHAWDICAQADDFSDEYIVTGMVSLLTHYRSQRSWSLARKLIKSVDAHILEHFDDTRLGQDWHILKHLIASDMGDRGTADTIIKKIRAEGENRHWIELKKKRGFLNRHANNRRWQKALEGSESILLKLQDLSLSVAPWKYGEEMDIHIFRHVCFEAMGDEESADLELKKAVRLKEFGGDERIPEMMVFVYCLQSTAAIRRNDCAEAHRLLGLAETMPACNQPLIIVTIKSHRARLLDHQGQYMEAAIIARQAILLAADQQRQLCSQDNEPTSWLFFFSKHLTKIFWLLEELCIWRLKMPQNGLLWAERSRLRFLMHQVYSQHVETAIPDPAVLDECDQQLMMVIKAVVEVLGPKTAIIEYSYTEYYSLNEDRESEEKSVIYMYVVRLSPTNDKRTMAYHRICQFGNWLQDAGLPTRTKLKELIEDACPKLDSKADETRRMKALSTLHSLLVQFVEDEIEGCDTLVFSPGHGCLATVPFHALYDDKKQEFLIESRGVSVIPSIVALHRCLYGQQKFETNLQLPNASVQVIPSDLGTSQRQSQVDRRIHSKVAFIAGNPEPMGLKRLHLQQLPYAEREAKEVASYFKVNPCLGKNMTKQAVLEGLSTNSVVLLATHGVIEDERYPHGCLVLQAPTRPDDDFASTTDIMQDDDSEKGGRRSLRVFEDTATEEADQVLTAAEIGALEGGVSAGLVVLSVCESGLGEATHGEGLLGLGRALLKAGALTAILTLWKVSERPTYEFMTRLFKELTSAAPRGRNVCECMRIVMCAMIAKKEPVRDWAPFTILGLPTLRLSMPTDNRGVTGLDKHSYPLFSTSNSCPYPCKVCDASIVNKPRGFLLEDPNNVYAGLAHLGERGQLEEAMRRGARIKPAREARERFKLAEASGIPVYFILGQPVGSNSSVFHI